MEVIKPVFTTYQLDVAVVTPVHVGTAQEKNYTAGLDFVADGEQAIFFNVNALLSAVLPTELQSLTAAFTQGDIKQSGTLLLAYAKKYPATVQRRMPLEGDPAEIRRFYRTGLGQYGLPGTSLKGAIRSILLAKLKDMETKSNRQRDDLTSLMGNVTDNLMRYLHVGDVVLQPEQIAIRRTKIFSADKDKFKGERGEWKQAFKGEHTPGFGGDAFATFYEAAIPTPALSHVASLTIRIGSQLPHELGKYVAERNSETGRDKVPNYRQLFQKNDAAWLVSVIKTHTKRYLKREREFFTRFPNREIADIVDQIDELLRMNGEPDNCLLRAGAGVGFHSITGDWQDRSDTDHAQSWIDGSGDEWLDEKKRVNHKKLRQQIFAKTRKFAYWDVPNGRVLALMGFLKLTLHNTP